MCFNDDRMWRNVAFISVLCFPRTFGEYCRSTWSYAIAAFSSHLSMVYFCAEAANIGF